MIVAQICKRFGNSFYKISNVPCKANDYFALSVLYFSTSVAKKAVRNDMLLEILLKKHRLSRQAASQAASALSHVRSPEKIDAGLSFFKETGFSQSQLEKVTKYRPQLLSSSLEKYIKPKIKIFQDLGYSSDDLAELISNDPWVLRRRVSIINSSISVLKGFLGSNAEVARLLKVSGWFLASDLRKTLEPNVDLLTSCGVPLDRLVYIVFHFPRFLLNDPENLRKCVEKAVEMGVNRSSKIFIHAVRVLSSLTETTWKLKLQVLRDIGFSEEDILRVFRQAPVVFNISEHKMKKVAEVVRSTRKYDVSGIFTYPTALCRSVEKWYKPRFIVLETLERKSMINKWPSFSTFCRMSDTDFVEKYVAPYEDLVGDMYYRNSKSKVKHLRGGSSQ